MNRGRQSGGPMPGFSCWGNAKPWAVWKVVGARRSATAVELPVEKRERDVVRRPDDSSGLEQLARRVRHRAAMDEVVDQLPGRPERAEHEHRDEHDRERAQQPRERRLILPGSPAITATSNTPSTSGSSHCGPNRPASGSRIERMPSLRRTAPAMGQRGSPTTPSLCRSRRPSHVSVPRSGPGVTRDASYEAPRSGSRARTSTRARLRTEAAAAPDSCTSDSTSRAIPRPIRP